MALFDIVTGGAGFIGSHIVDALLAEGRRVLAIDDLAVGRRTNWPSTPQTNGSASSRRASATVTA
jgi:nucleoside-diphosphate-sugar epimerase